jgi:hypothetical protein
MGLGGGLGMGGFGYGGFMPGYYGPGLGYGLGYSGFGLGNGLGGYGFGYGLGNGLGYGTYSAYPGSVFSFRYSGYPYGSGSLYTRYYPYSPYYPSSGSLTFSSPYAAPSVDTAGKALYTYSSAYGPSPTTNAATKPTYPLPSLGIDETAVLDGEIHGIRVSRVDDDSPAARAGLQVGDVIHSANGYLTHEPGNLAWVIHHHATNKNLNLEVRRADSSKESKVIVNLK